MRGRKPQPVVIAGSDRWQLQRIARSLCRPWFQVQRSRILLARAHGQGVSNVAHQMQCGISTVSRACSRYVQAGLSGLLTRATQTGRPSAISPLQRARIVELACLEPVAKGLHVTHWTSADLAREAVCERIVSAISARTVRRILHEVDLQPHRTRFWKTARLDAEFMKRAIRILWCYTYAEHLAHRGWWVVCEDELPNFQILERQPIRRAVPGLIERQEFEYKRHGTTNVLAFLVVHSGRMNALCLQPKDANNYIATLRWFRHHHRHLDGVYLIHDNDSSHTADQTQSYFADSRNWWHPCPTPSHASWLNQAELLLNVFELHYLKRGSWHTRNEFMDHVTAAWPEYNHLYAHPFDWEWSIPKMRKWFMNHAD